MLLCRVDYRFDLKGAYPVKLPILFNVSQIIIEIVCDRKPATWNIAGNIEQTALVENVGFCSIRNFPVGFNKEAYELVKAQSNLIFKPVKWLNRNTSIRIYKMPLSQSSNISVSSTPIKSTSTVNHFIGSSTIFAFLMSENVNRLGFSITNSANATLFIDYVSAPTSTQYAVAIPPKSYFESPINFTGDVLGVWSADDVGEGAYIREFV